MSANVHRTPRLADSRTFYLWMAAAIALIAFVGFAPTYYLSALFGARNWPPLVHVHAALFTAWVAVLVTQATLIRAGLTHVHRRIGSLAALLAIAMLPVGTLVAIRAARRGLAPDGVDALTFMIVPLGALVVFATLVAVAIANRRRPEWHKRFMLIVRFAILTPAIARFAIVGQRPVIALVLSGLLVVLVAARDFRALGRVHAAAQLVAAVLTRLINIPINRQPVVSRKFTQSVQAR